jgi:DNA helicase-2/ATP-dependent DNA helicase PcrA
VDNIAQAQEQDEDLLVLSTIHSAKGLEWQSVFVIWLAEGRFPSMYSLDDDEALEEELRLLYVATTRAMQHLYLTYPVYGGHAWGNAFGRPSRFLEGIARHHVEQWSLTEEQVEGVVEDEFV